MRTTRKEKDKRLVGTMASEYAFELSGNGGVSPVAPPLPLLDVVGVVGANGLLEVCVVGEFPPAVLKMCKIPAISPYIL